MARDLARGVDSDCTDTPLAFGGNNTAGPIDCATALAAHGGPHGRLDFASETFVVAAFSCKDHGADAGDIALTLRAMGHAGSHANAGGQIAVAIPILEAGARTGASSASPKAGAGIGRAGDPMFTLQAGSGVRRLTPKECERLQGFPDGWTNVPYRGKPAADGPRYKALGNSMAVPVMAWIGERIQMVEDLMQEAAE
jgi:DNA (cytosine-5)-methyltransferase 1